MTTTTKIDPCKILLAEDDATSRLVMGKTLESAGHTVLYADDGLLALEILRVNQGIEILITDEQMPRLTGTELIRVVRGNPKLANLGIVVVSGVIRVHEVAVLLEGGADRFFPKPPDPKQLIREISSLQRELANHRMLRDKAKRERKAAANQATGS